MVTDWNTPFIDSICEVVGWQSHSRVHPYFLTLVEMHLPHADGVLLNSLWQASKYGNLYSTVFAQWQKANEFWPLLQALEIAEPGYVAERDAIAFLYKSLVGQVPINHKICSYRMQYQIVIKLKKREEMEKDRLYLRWGKIFQEKYSLKVIMERFEELLVQRANS